MNVLLYIHSLYFNLNYPIGNKSIGDNEAKILLSALPYSWNLEELKLNGTSISNEIIQEIHKQINISQSLIPIYQQNLEISELIILNKISEVKEILNRNIDNIKFLQEMLFICCVWNKIELFEFILNQNIDIDINSQLEVNIYFYFILFNNLLIIITFF